MDKVMRTIFSRKKNTKATRNGFSEYSEIVKQDGTRDVLPNVPVSDYSSIDELIHSLQIKTIDFGPEDQLLLFGAIADDEGRKAGILLSDAKPWLTGYGSQKISYDRLAEWIRQNDRAHLLFDGYSHAGYDNSVSGILHQLCDILQTLSDHKIIPEFTFRIFRDYV